MITTEYVWMLAAALVLGMAALAGRLHLRGMKPVTAAAALPMCGVLGVGCAWAAYKLLMFMMPVASFSYCFVAGVLGVVLGIALAAKLCRQPVLAVLDVSGAVICFIVMFARLGEHFMKNVGWGSSLPEGSWLCRVPFAVPVVWDEWFTEWYAAIYVLEALLALSAMVVAMGVFDRDRKIPGLAFERTMYLLAIPQILGEQLRSMPMAWGFVKVEQILCAVLAVILLGRSCYRWGKFKPAKPVSIWWPIAAFLACVGVVMACEFALDGKIELPVEVSWSLFIGSLLVMLGLECFAARRLRRAM